jgi:hypothetical protein
MNLGLGMRRDAHVFQFHATVIQVMIAVCSDNCLVTNTTTDDNHLELFECRQNRSAVVKA